MNGFMAFDKLRPNGLLLIPFVVSPSNHERNQLVPGFLRGGRALLFFSIHSHPFILRQANCKLSFDRPNGIHSYFVPDQ